MDATLNPLRFKDNKIAEVPKLQVFNTVEW